MLRVLSQRKIVRKRIKVLRGRLFRTAYAWCHNRALADDLVQETSLRALENAGRLRDPDAVDAWVFRILANCHRSHLRRLGGDSGFEAIAEVADHTADPEHLVDERDLVERVRAAMAALNPEQRKVLSLVDLEGFSYTEVATILEIPVGTVMSRLCRARRRLKARLQTPVAAPGGRVIYLHRTQ